MNSWAPTAVAAATDLLVRRVRAGRTRCCRGQCPAKRKPSCGTIPSCRRSDSCVMSRRSCRRRDPALDAGRRTARAAWRSSTCPRRCARRARPSSRPGRRGRSRAAPPAPCRSRTARSRTGRRPSIRASSRGARRGRATSGSSSMHVHDLVERRDGGQERVVELRELLDGVEEVREVEDEREAASRP